MELFLSLAAALGALFVGVVSPGPSFLLIARTSVATSRKEGLFASLGMGAGAVIFAVLVLLGLQVLLARVPWLYLALQIAGGLYLIYMAARMIRKAGEPLVLGQEAEAHSKASAPVPPALARKAFLLGLFTQLSNPKTAVVYGSVFAALLPKELPLPVLLALPFLIFVIETGWYSLVAFLLSAPAPRNSYLRAKTGIDRAAGGILGLLGVKLLVDSRPSA